MKKRLLWLLVLVLGAGIVSTLSAQEATEEAPPPPPTLLSDPFLQLPTEDSVRVVWFTEWAGSDHTVTVNDTEFPAETMQLSRTAEDQDSRVGTQTESGTLYNRTTPRPVWRHEAHVTALAVAERVPYTVRSVAEDGTVIERGPFTLAPLPQPGDPLTILLTSDHQLRENTPPNLQMVERVAGRVDAVFFSGDLVNIPDRASEWFDDNRGYAFFPGLQGLGGVTISRTRTEDDITVNTTRTYAGGELIQHAPLFPATGNHEVMGRYNPGNTTGTQYNDPQPREVAEARYEQVADLVNPTGDAAVRAQWILDNSFNSITYEELFTLPNDGPGGETYYALQFGDVYLISLYSTRIWRSPGLADGTRGKYRERLADFNTPDNWGYGDFIFEDLAEGSPQHTWLLGQLESEAFQNARYRIVLMHQGPHGVGDNYNPVFAHPEQTITYDEDGRIEYVAYEYPLDADILQRDVVPLFVEHGVDLVHMGHSHVWFRIDVDGVMYLETSNVGNNFGCYLEGYKTRGNVPNDERYYDPADYAPFGDPHGGEPIFPSEFSPQQDDAGNDLPCVNSNDLTVFTLLNTEGGTVESYVFDTRDPQSEPLLFDVFTIGSNR